MALGSDEALGSFHQNAELGTTSIRSEIVAETLIPRKKSEEEVVVRVPQFGKSVQLHNIRPAIGVCPITELHILKF